jgi:hypothetical protein
MYKQATIRDQNFIPDPAEPILSEACPERSRRVEGLHPGSYWAQGRPFDFAAYAATLRANGAIFPGSRRLTRITSYPPLTRITDRTNLKLVRSPGGSRT